VFGTRSCKFIFAVGALRLLSGCQYVGPVAIDQGRDRYNHIIESTSKEQTFANILRVYHHEPTLFMDVTEVDATTTFSGAATGGVSSIGARAGTSGGTLAGQTGSAAGGLTYSESPLIRYQPLLGQALVAQLVTPVSPDALVSLFDSSWNITPLIDFSAAYLTPDFTEFYAALNVIAELDDDEAVALVATKSDLTKEKDSTKNEQSDKDDKDGQSDKKVQSPLPKVIVEVTNKPASNGAVDSVVIYLNPFRSSGDLPKRRRDLQLWIKLLWLYSGTQKDFPPQTPLNCPQLGAADLDRRLKSANREFLELVRSCLPNFIELRTVPVKTEQSRQAGLRTGVPLLRTYSGLGILKNATEDPTPRIGFVDPEKYRAILAYRWNKNVDTLAFYTLNPNDESIDKYPNVNEYEVDTIRHELSAWLDKHSERPFLYEPEHADPYGDDYVKVNRVLGLLRRYILIIHSNNAPANAYVAYFDRGEWYYIDADDATSQKNFDLIALFMTMMASPPTTPPLSPTISVGGM
jgi:hypothetical protein